MGDLRICRICVTTGTKMYRLDRFYLRNYYEEVTASKINDNDNLPRYFCYECAMMLHKFHKFKEKCYSGLKVLKEIQWRGPITYQSVSKIDRSLRNIQSILQIIKVTKRIKHYNIVGDDPPEYVVIPSKCEDNTPECEDYNPKCEENTQECEENTQECEEFTQEFEDNPPESEDNLPECDDNRSEYGDSHVEGVDESFIKAEDQTVEVEVEVDYIGDHTYSEVDPMAEDPSAIDTSAIEAIDTTEEVISSDFQTMYVIKEEGNKRLLNTEEDIVDMYEEGQVQSSSGRRGRCLSDSKWKKYVLMEDDAVKEFCARAHSSGYLRANYKCTDCYKGFSQEDMMMRHIQLRHDKTLKNECRFCKMRFRWKSALTMHMRQHFMKYQCQLCTFVCARENSALLHEEFHSGVKRQCLHCGQMFRHSSTYYTHMRMSHRSEYICSICGASFVSETGLHQHKQLKHVTTDIQDSPDDYEEVNTYCERCNITFTSRKAYEEHVFHSAMHTDGVEHVVQDEVTIPNKVLSKRIRAEVTKRLSNRPTTEDDPNAPKKRRRRKIKRMRTKPTTCYQCGKHFDTQSACMKHHYAEHPGTCFTPPALRHICELCGVSLAPGSVAIHKNMHTREKIYSCDTCGKEFHSTIGLKRHLVTHTGEKPFACSLCDKRFTQSNSMKLHYRTFHLKEPYPKRRDRPKKRKDKAAAEESFSEEEMRSELDSPPDPKHVEAIESELIMMEVQDDDSVHYLTLN